MTFAYFTCEVYVAVGQWQQRGVQRVEAVAQDGVSLVNLLHQFRVQTVLLHTTTSQLFSEVLSNAPSEQAL